MSTAQATPPTHKRAIEGSATWRKRDRVGLALCWALGLTFCAITVAIVAFLFVQGIGNLKLSMFVTSPSAANVNHGGGFLDPLEGTFIVAGLGMAIALPVGVTTAVWLSEYGRPFALARAVESVVDMIAGIPTIVLALFGLLIFRYPLLGFLSQSTGHVVFGRSFFAAGIMLSLVALPLIVGSTREGLQAIPSRVREASYAVGKTRWATIRRILLPSARPSIVTGATLGLGRIIGDTAIITFLLGATLDLDPASSTAIIGTLRGTGSTLTSYVYGNAPTGDFNQPDKAYAAAFVLLVLVLLLNVIVDVVVSRSKVTAWTR